MVILVGGAIGAPAVFAADQTTGQSIGLLQKYGLGGMLTASPQPTSSTGSSVSPRPTGDKSCTASYSGNGFQGNITVKAGAEAITGWKVTLPLTNGRKITQGGKVKLTTRGATVVASNEPDNGSLAAGASTGFGFTGGGPAGNSTLSCTAF